MKKLNISKKIYLLIIASFMSIILAYSQTRPSIALVSIDTKDLGMENESMSSLVRLELEKLDRFEVLDRYDVNDIIQQNNIDPDNCFGKTKVTKAGKLLGSEKMLTGSAEKLGEKIVLILRLIDVNSSKIEKTSVMEYLNVTNEIQNMIHISLNDLFDIPNDEHLVDLLIDYNLPITNMKTTLSLNGPRMGAVYTTGDTGRRLQDSQAKGGYNMFPITSMFGYQYEFQYLSSGGFQALVEIIGSVNGLESGQFIPSITFMNGFRFSKSGYEIGLGPIFRIIKIARGYYDNDGNWKMVYDINPDDITEYNFVDRIDNRGNFRASVGLIIAAGKTFRSGYLNMPVNLFFSPRKDGSVIGLTFGFNTTKKPELK